MAGLVVNLGLILIGMDTGISGVSCLLPELILADVVLP
jgi:hypothetical protein